jgi:pyruvate dehydrogenase E1 component
MSHLKTVEQRLLWLSHWMIHNANNIRPKADGIKVGGHQASSASMVSIMTALYFSALRPEDRVAVKPHASPVFHAMQYLMGNQTQQNMENFRGLGGVQSYPSRTKDVDDVDFSTGSVGLGVGITSFASLVQDFIAAKSWGEDFQPARMVALVGDAELDEGNIYETLQEGWKNDLRNCVVDHRLQPAVAGRGGARGAVRTRIERIFEAFGWDVVTREVRRALQRAAFAEPGGEKLARVDRCNCPNQLYSALTYQGGAVWRQHLMDDLGDQGDVSALIDARSDAALAALMENLGGNCVETMAETFAAIDHDRPVCFLAYTIKGWATPIAGHKDNHGGLMTKAQMVDWQKAMGVPEGAEWEPLATVQDKAGFQAFLDEVPFFAEGRRRLQDAALPVPAIALHAGPRDRHANGVWQDPRRPVERRWRPGRAHRHDVAGCHRHNQSRRMGEQAQTVRPPQIADTFRDRSIPSTARWEFTPHGQHIELGIAEMNLMLLLGAAGLSHSLFGKRLIPIGTVYDPFVSRGLDALNYACYQDARFMLVGTPSGVTLAPEGGAHQSIALASDRDVAGRAGGVRTGLRRRAFRDHGMGLRLHAARRRGRSGRAHMVARRDWRVSLPAVDHQPHRAAGQAGGRNFPAGHHRRGLLAEGTRTQLFDVVIAYQGAVAPEAIRAAGIVGAARRDVGVLAVTSADRLNAGWTAAQRARARGNAAARAHIETLLGALPPHTRIVTVIDGHPATLAWLGSVAGHQTFPLGVEHFGQTGTIGDLYHHFGIDRDALVRSAMSLTAGRK